MDTVYHLGKSYSLSQSKCLGEGGEARVYIMNVGANSMAFKIWRQPDDPYYLDITDPKQRSRDIEGARLRLQIMAEKLRRYPKAWSERVILPINPITDRAGKKLLGYSMPIVENAIVLRDLAKRKTRPVSYDPNMGIKVFRDLHSTLTITHESANVVIGDFNYFNILVRTSDWTAHVIDADSMQFGTFFCRTFQPRFVDPLICDQRELRLVQALPHTKLSDWYAYSAMLFEIMMLVPFYGGSYEPSRGREMVELDSRPLKRISIFDKDVVYPKAAIPLDALSDDILDFYHRLVIKDERGVFPLNLIENLRWTVCSRCGKEHAKNICPNCSQVTPVVARKEAIRGKVRVLRVFASSGLILRASVFNNKLHVLFHMNGAFYRTICNYSQSVKSFVSSTPQKLIDGELVPEMKFSIQPDKTLIGIKSTLFLIDQSGAVNPIAVDQDPLRTPMFSANETNYYFANSGELLRDTQRNDSTILIGKLVQDSTYFWMGRKFGFGFYRVGNVQVSFVFDAKSGGLNDSVKLPQIRGQILEASCSFDDHRCWLFTVTRDGSKVTNAIYVISRDGSVTASSHASENDSSWLGQLGGRVAISFPKKGGGNVHGMLVANDNGITRIHEDQSALIEGAYFPDTKGFVDSNHELLLGNDGIYTLERHLIQCIQLLP